MRRTNSIHTPRFTRRTACSIEKVVITKGVILVKYQKPELVVLAGAVRLIESHVKPDGMTDNPDTNPNKTSTAYEADE
jgi:hypothetical protein